MFGDLYCHEDDCVGGVAPIAEPSVARPIPSYTFDPGVHASLIRRGTNLHAPIPQRIRIADSMQSVFSAILAEMSSAEALPKVAGGTKKNYVLAALEMGGMISAENREEVSMLIELVIFLARQPEALKIFRASQAGCVGLCRQS